MAYKTILVHADLSRHAPARIAMAAALALEHGAMLVGAAATGVSPLVYPAEQGGFPGGLLDEYFGALRAKLEAALEQFQRLAAPTGLPFDKRMVIEDAGEGLAALARFADLVVISQDDPGEALAHDDPRLPEYLILNTPRPVLVVPSAASHDPQPPAQPPRHILLAWNGSRQAASALAHALPLLQHADDVSIASFSEDRSDLASSAAEVDRADLLAYLGRHGVQATIQARAETVDMGHAILDLASELERDLIVMGCYGHSRLRELCLGGVSRTLLRCSPVPLLLVHV